MTNKTIKILMQATKRWLSVFCLLAIYGGYDRIGELINNSSFVKQATKRFIFLQI
jgi:hypothetical protein